MSNRRGSSRDRSSLVIILSLLIIIVAVLRGQNIDDLVEEIRDRVEQQDEVPREETDFSGGWYDLYFTEPLGSEDPTLQTGSQVEAAVIGAINSAQRSVYGAMFELNLPGVIQALTDAAERGIEVKLVVDDRATVEEEPELVQLLRDAGVEVRDDGRSALMHHKFLVIDESRVWMGSMNFTLNGVYLNNNNAVLIRSTKLAENYLNEFREMFEDQFFARQGDPRDVPNRQFTIDGTLIETYFSPEDGDLIEQRIITLINEADTSVRAMAFSFTLDTIANAMVGAHQRGIDVAAIFEQRQDNAPAENIVFCSGIPTHLDGNNYTFHHKVFVIDNDTVIFGSFNFSASARDRNSENLLIIHNTAFAEQFTAEFDRRFNEEGAEVPVIACN